MSLSNGGVLALGAGPRAVRVPGQHRADQGVQVCSNNNNRLYGRILPQGCTGDITKITIGTQCTKLGGAAIKVVDPDPDPH
jgi:hypothetical protein